MANGDTFSKQMGCSHAEFRRTLPAAVVPFRVREAGGAFELCDDSGRRVSIVLGEEGRRRIASLQIPTTRVDFRFREFSSEERARFMERFNRYYQRGGG